MSATQERGLMTKPSLRKSALFVTVIFLLILAIQIMKAGAGGLGFYLRNMFDFNNPLNTMGFGWLSATFILSGSPISASALAFFDAGALSEMEAFAMVIGSRFGASFAILLIGFLYHMRGHERHTSISLGILTLLMTYSLYSGGIFLGILLLRYDVLDFMQFNLPAFISNTISFLFDPIVEGLTSRLNGMLVFLVGLGLIMLAFKLLDDALPKVDLKETRFRQTARYIYRPWVMFSLGFFITLITTSVSVSLGLLVPLSARGYIKVENLVPYIMGANISTFIDTLLVAILLANPAAFTIVFAGIIGTILVSSVILFFFFRVYEKFLLDALSIISRSNVNLTAFLAATFLIPVLLLLI